MLLDGLQGEETEFTPDDWQSIRREALEQCRRVQKGPS